jgi:hypothetical protein
MEGRPARCQDGGLDGSVTSKTTKLSPSSPQRTISEYDGSSNILGHPFDQIPSSWRRAPAETSVGAEDHQGGGGPEAYLYNLRTCFGTLSALFPPGAAMKPA